LNLETKELVVMTTRILSDDIAEVGTEGLPHYQKLRERMDRELEERYGKRESPGSAVS